MSMVQNLEYQLQNIKKFREQADKAMRLAQIPEFRELILEGFCRDEMARLAHVAGDPGVGKEEREVAADTSRAGGHLKRYLNIMIQQADLAERDRQAVEEQLAHVRAMEDTATDGGGFTTLGGEPAYDLEDEEQG